MYLLARENLYGVTHGDDWGKKLDEQFHYFLHTFIATTNRSGATLPLAIAEDENANFRAFASHNGLLLVLGMLKVHIDKAELVRCGMALLIVSVNILRNNVAHSALESEAISAELASFRNNAPAGKMTMKSLKGMLKKKPGAKKGAFGLMGGGGGGGGGGGDTKSSEGSSSEDNDAGKTGFTGLFGRTVQGADKGGDGGGGGLKAFHLAGDLATHRGLIEWSTITLANFADSGRSVSVCVNILLHSVVFSVRQLALRLMSVLVTTTAYSCRAMLLPLNSSIESLEAAAKGDAAFWTKHDHQSDAGETGKGGKDGADGTDSPLKKKKPAKKVKKVPTALEKSLESAFASTASFPIIAKRLGVYCPENDPKVREAKRKKMKQAMAATSHASKNHQERDAAEASLSKEELRRKEKEKMAKEHDAREKGPCCLSYVLSLAKNERNSTIFAAAADIVLALTCDLDIPSHKTASLSVGPVSLTAKNTRTTAIIGTTGSGHGPMHMPRSKPTTIGFQDNSLISGKHKTDSHVSGNIATAAAAAAATGGEVTAAVHAAAHAGTHSNDEKLHEMEHEMASLMSAFCHKVSKTPTCTIPTPDATNVAMGTVNKGPTLTKKLRKQMEAAGSDPVKDDGGRAKEEGEGGGDGRGENIHMDWACLELLISFMDRNMRYLHHEHGHRYALNTMPENVHILGKGGLSQQQHQELVYAFCRCVAAVSRLGIKSREALYHMHEMGGVDSIISTAMTGLRAHSRADASNTSADAVPENRVYINERDLSSLEALATQAMELLKREKKKFLAQAVEIQRSKGIYIGKDGKETRLRPKAERKTVNSRKVNVPMSFSGRPATAPNNLVPSGENSLGAFNSMDESEESSVFKDYKDDGGYNAMAQGGSFGAPAMKKANAREAAMNDAIMMPGFPDDDEGPPVLRDATGNVLVGPGQAGLQRGHTDLLAPMQQRPGTTGGMGKSGGIRPLSRDFGKAYRPDCAYAIPEFPPRRGLSPKHRSRDDNTSLHKVLFQGKVSETPGIPPQLTDDDVERTIDDLALRYDGNNQGTTNLTATNPLSTERYLAGGLMEGSMSMEGESPLVQPHIQGSMKLPEGMLEARKLLRALQKSNHGIESKLKKIGYTDNGRNSIPIIERARRVYYPAGDEITAEMQELGDLGSSSTTYVKPPSSPGIDALQTQTSAIQSDNFDRAEAHVTSSFEVSEDAKKHKAFIESMLEITKDVVKEVDTQSVLRDVSSREGSDYIEEGMRRAGGLREVSSREGSGMVEEGLRRAVSSREGSRESSREPGLRPSAALSGEEKQAMPNVRPSQMHSVSFSSADIDSKAGSASGANGETPSAFVDSFGFYEPEIEKRMKEAAAVAVAEEKVSSSPMRDYGDISGDGNGAKGNAPPQVIPARGLYGVGMTTDDFDFDMPELMDLKPIYALGTETLFPDKEDEEEKEKRAQEKQQAQKASEEKAAAAPKVLTEEEKKKNAQEGELKAEMAKMGFGAFEYDEHYGEMSAREAADEDEESEAPYMHASGSRAFNAEIDSLPPSARAEASSAANFAVEMAEEKAKQRKLGLQQDLVKSANLIEAEKKVSNTGRVRKPEAGYKESAASRMVKQGENAEFLFPDQRTGK
jgi:hypothetical protein